MSYTQKDQMVDMLMDWLENYGATIDDILYDGEGDGFIMSESDNGNPGEDGYDVYFKKVYIPKELQPIL